MANIQYQPEHLRAIVDMGSNGVRFSISSLQPPTERILPTVYQQRVGISLYDAQYTATGEKVPIPRKTIADIISSFRHFRRTCQDFGVSEKNVAVLATEATRGATNSGEFRSCIAQELGWNVNMLPKDEEGRVGAMGIASSLPEVNGLVMDLGGGSTQLSWLIKKSGSGDVQMPESGAVSMPYGAAALSRRLAEAEKNGTMEVLKNEVQSSVEQAYASLKVPTDLEESAREQGGFVLYLSGGGFRGWGYVLMSQHRVTPYPIPIINGFKADRNEFLNTRDVTAAAAASLDDDEEQNIFRVSDRRAGQVPAVAFLINSLVQAVPMIKEVRFCQGGVREGHLFSSMPSDVRAQKPLVVATQSFGNMRFSEAVVTLIESSIPCRSTQKSKDDYENIFTRDLFTAFSNLLYYHASHPKDLQASCALRCTTSGILSSVHGIIHESRALLALLLCARWGGSVPPTDELFKQNLEQLVASPWAMWWIRYIGAVAQLIATVYPSTTSPENNRLNLRSWWDESGKHGPVLSLSAQVLQEIDQETFVKETKMVEKVGKRKNWIGGKDGVGYKVHVDVSPS